jgi:hypothetical protein
MRPMVFLMPCGPLLCSRPLLLWPSASFNLSRSSAGCADLGDRDAEMQIVREGYLLGEDAGREEYALRR